MTKVTVELDGKKVKLTDFPEKIIGETIVAMLKTLRGVEDVRNAVIRLERE